MNILDLHKRCSWMPTCTEVSRETFCGHAGGVSLPIRGREEGRGSKETIRRQVSQWQVFSITAHLLIRKRHLFDPRGAVSRKALDHSVTNRSFV